MRVQAIWLLTALVGCGGGGGDATNDAAVVDVPEIPDARVDAAIDATPDAYTWSCEPQPEALREDTVVPVVAFDARLPIPEHSWGLIDTFVAGDELWIVGSSQLHVVGLDGVVARTIPLPAGGDADVNVRTVAGVPGAMAALVDLYEPGVPTLFCPLDFEVGIELARCTTLRAAQITWAQLVPVADGFDVYTTLSTGLHRTRFAVDGSQQETTLLWDDAGATQVVDVAAGAAGTFVTTRANLRCALQSNVLTDEGREIIPLELPEHTYAGVSSLYARSGYSTEVRVLLKEMACAATSEPCSTSTGERPMSVLVRYDLASGEVELRPVPMHLSDAAIVIPDGDLTAVVYRWSFYDIRVSLYDREGHALVSHARIPLSPSETGVEVQQLFAGRALGPRDYVFVYTGTGPGGPDSRVARFTLPEP